MPSDRPAPKVGGIEFSVYGGNTQPMVDVETEARYEKLEPIGAPVVQQYLGEKPDEVSVTGECTESEAEKVDGLTENSKVEVRTARWSGTATVNSTSTTAQRKKDAQKGWIYSYTIELTEVSAVSEEGDEEEGTETVTLIAGDVGPVDG